MHYPGLLISKKIPFSQWDITEEENYKNFYVNKFKVIYYY